MKPGYDSVGNWGCPNGCRARCLCYIPEFGAPQLAQIHDHLYEELTGDPGGAPVSNTLKDVIQECWDTSEAHGFHGVKRTFGDTIALIHSELSEAYEAYRVDGNHNVHQIDGKPEGTVVELADAVIRVFDTAVGECGQTAGSFATLILEKMRYNRGRPFLHGKII